MKPRTITAITFLSGVLSVVGCKSREDVASPKPLPSVQEEEPPIGYIPQPILDHIPIAVEKLKNNSVTRSIANFQGKPEELGKLLSEYIALAEKNIPKLQYDKAGWHGNDLISFVDENLAPQFNCDGEARIVLKILYALQRKGFLCDYDFHYEYLRNHTAVGVSRWNNERLSDTIFIIDPWLSSPGEPPRLFFSGILSNANEVWRKAIEEFTNKQNDEKEKFSSRFKYNRQSVLNRPALFDHDLWDKIDIKLHLDYVASTDESDFVFFKYFASPDSSLRFAIKKDYFALVRDKMICCLEAEGKLSKEEKKQLQDLTLENKTPEEKVKVWKAFQPYINLYFKSMYSDPVSH